MACSILATAGDPAATSYATVAEADAFHEQSVDGASWAALTSDEKCRALVTATRHLDYSVEWDGTATTTTQALAWPRSGLVDARTGVDLSELTLPDALVWACAEQARLVAALNRALPLDQQEQGLAMISAGGVTLTFQGGTATSRPVLGPTAWAFVRQWGTPKRLAKDSGAVPLVRM